MPRGPARALSPAELDLYDHVPREVAARARIVMVPFLTRGTGGMSLGRWVLLRRGRERDEVLLAHELVHVHQWSRLGVPGFLVRYLGAYFANLVRLRRHHRAYLEISFEVAARDVARAWDERRRRA